MYFLYPVEMLGLKPARSLTSQMSPVLDTGLYHLVCYVCITKLYEKLDTSKLECSHLISVPRKSKYFCLDFCKAFDTVPHNMLLSKWEGNVFGVWIVGWNRNCLNGYIHRIVVKGSMFKIGDQ